MLPQLQPRWSVDTAYAAAASMAGIISKEISEPPEFDGGITAWQSMKRDRKLAYEKRVTDVREARRHARLQGMEWSHLITPRMPDTFSESDEEFPTKWSPEVDWKRLKRRDALASQWRNRSQQPNFTRPYVYCEPQVSQQSYF